MINATAATRARSDHGLRWRTRRSCPRVVSASLQVFMAMEGRKEVEDARLERLCFDEGCSPQRATILAGNSNRLVSVAVQTV